MITKLVGSQQSLILLIQYLKDVDLDFSIPLSQKIELDSYAEKLLTYGNIHVSIEDDQIEAIIGYYSNDFERYTAVLSILSTKEKARGKGIAKKLVIEAIDVCKKNQMKHFIVDSVNPIAINLYKSLGFKLFKTEIINGLIKEYLVLDF